MKRRFSRYTARISFLLLLLTGAVFFLNSPILAVSSIAVQGNEELTKEQVIQIADIREPVNIFAVKTDYLQKRLESDLRIAKASVRRSFPNVLLIDIKERKPIATLRCNYGYVDIAGNGIIMNSYRNMQTMKFPMMTGITLGDVYIGDKIDDANVLKAAAFLEQMDSTALAQISEISIISPQNIVAYTTGGVKIKLGDLSFSEQEAKKTAVFLNDLKTMKKPVEYVDFGYISPVLKFKS
ncbi:cell division protein FtsQ/DivIB [Pectinatus haikarae]|uniref:Cell division protein FtsQ n=1 Tax=Pectinatus haikarae TaxID=349096 RepID=A0ABT9Y6P0_9FIRM|nr:FtsQ-type POTRA domain-containing protein [Pectinatus haikarae]MDQ0203483.1 cell division protein FtsQ [Pectinatus haikarae]